MGGLAAAAATPRAQQPAKARPASISPGLPTARQPELVRHSPPTWSLAGEQTGSIMPIAQARRALALPDKIANGRRPTSTAAPSSTPTSSAAACNGPRRRNAAGTPEDHGGGYFRRRLRHRCATCSQSEKPY